MSAVIIAALRGAVFQAIAILGEKKARNIINNCFDQMAQDHYGK